MLTRRRHIAALDQPHEKVRQLAYRRRLRYSIIVGLVVAGLILLIMSSQLFDQLTLRSTNLLYVAQSLSNNIVIVGIDDRALSAYGRSVAEWSRSYHAQLINTLSSAGARVVTFDILFTEPSEDDAIFAQAITQARNSEARTRVILAGSGSHSLTTATNTYSSFSMPTSSLAKVVAWVGHVNSFPDHDSFVRRLPLYIYVGKTPYYSLIVTSYLSYLGISPALADKVITLLPKALQLTSERWLPLDANQSMLINFFGPPNTFPVYSYAAVINNEVDPAVFKGKIVLVGVMNAAGTTDRYLIPLNENGELMSGVEILANALETIIQNKPLQTVPLIWQTVFVIGLVLSSALILSSRRWYVVLIIAVLLGLVVFLLSSVLFSVYHIIFPLFYPFLGIAGVVFGLLVTNIVWEAYRRQQDSALLDAANHLIQRRLILKDLLGQLTSDMQRIMGCTQPGVAVWDEDDNEVESIFPPLDKSAEIKQMINTNVEQAIKSRRPIVSHNLTVVPLIYQNRPLGALYNYSAAKPLSEEQLSMLNLYGELAAPAMATSQLYTRVLQQKDLLRAIQSSTPDPVLVIDQGNTLIDANPSALRIFNRTADNLWEPLQNWLENANIPTDSAEEIFGYLKGQAAFKSDLPIGKNHYILECAPLLTIQSGWVLLLHDVSSLKELDALKTQMIRMASHDLKNPLSVILGNIELLELDASTDDQRSSLRMVHSSAKRMQNIISDILNLERLRAQSLQISRVSLNQLIEEIYQDILPQAQEKRQKMILHPLPEDVYLLLDRAQMIEALGNLLNNANKYTPEDGQITIDLEQNAPHHVQITISDTGYGIPLAAQDRLFQPFYRVKMRETANIPGTGLGLSLVKTVINAHGGRIWFESEEGKGTTFFVELPLPIVNVMADDLTSSATVGNSEPSS